MTCVSCLIGLRYVEPLSSVSLHLFSSSCCFFHATHVIHPSSSRRCRLSGAIEAELPGCWVLLESGIDPRTWGRMDCDVIYVKSSPDESAKERFYLHVHGSHLLVSLAWSFPSPCFGRLCSHVTVALAWLLHTPVTPPKLFTKNPVIHFPEIDKACVYIFGIPGILENLLESRNLFFSATAATKNKNQIAKISILAPGPDLPIGYVGLSLGPQDPRGPPTNFGTHSQWPVYEHSHLTSSKIYVLIINHKI